MTSLEKINRIREHGRHLKIGRGTAKVEAIQWVVRRLVRRLESGVELPGAVLLVDRELERLERDVRRLGGTTITPFPRSELVFAGTVVNDFARAFGRA